MQRIGDGENREAELSVYVILIGRNSNPVGQCCGQIRGGQQIPVGSRHAAGASQGKPAAGHGDAANDWPDGGGDGKNTVAVKQVGVPK